MAVRPVLDDKELFQSANVKYADGTVCCQLFTMLVS